MDTIEKARTVIRDAEASLRNLITEAAAQHRYDDVKTLAELASRVAQLVERKSTELSVARPAPTDESPLDAETQEQLRRVLGGSPSAYKTAHPRRKKKRSPRPKGDYPKFVRDDDRLIKIGWSKKNKEEYEHRVPREAIVAFARHVDGKVDEGSKFDIESLLPVPDMSDGEVPGYQVYVVFAWLRTLGVVEKVGRDGYVIRDKSVLRGELDEQWNGLQTKSA
jgi:hypothetical protein